MDLLNDNSQVPYLIGTWLGDTVKVSLSSSSVSLSLSLLSYIALQSLYFRTLVGSLLWLLLVCSV